LESVPETLRLEVMGLSHVEALADLFVPGRGRRQDPV
jgi:hypothetical protein